ncbi:MAG: hypothetical protein KDA86_27335 [Planctomycetaceae bacterium]|nr:hypothetical protein [Planctomycetaceae bacterium]
MKVQHALTIAVIGLGVLLVSRLPVTFAEPVASSVKQSHRMLDLLTEGSVVQLDSVHQAYNVILLNEEQVQEFRDLVKRTEAEMQADEGQTPNGVEFGGEDQVRVARGRMVWRNIQSPWRVLMVGEDYVRLEPLAQLAGHEEVSWIALPGSMIQMIKSKSTVGHATF